MDAKVLFWTGALANMAAIVALALAGVRARRAGDVPRHRRLMLTAAGLVGLFLIAYVVKLLALGREDMSVWSSRAVWVLRFHELCVLVMLGAGAVAIRRGMALGRTRSATSDPADPPAPPTLAVRHRFAGRVAVGAAVLGLLSAAAVLVDMYRRAGVL